MEKITGWKNYLLNLGRAPGSVNAALSALNGFFRFCGWGDLRARFVRVQRRLFRDPGRELTKGHYRRLVSAARARGDERIALVMETICSTGIRVGEVKFITVEAVRSGRARINLKGKVREILLPGSLKTKLLRYARENKIASGEIFLTGGGKRLKRGQIWAAMKGLCADTGIEPSRVFPHNLRHLFATEYYSVSHDIVRLADVLGHSSIETTRIYLVTSGTEHQKLIEGLDLID